MKIYAGGGSVGSWWKWALYYVYVMVLGVMLQLRGVITLQRLSVASNAIDHPSLGHNNNNNNDNGFRD
jgi:hypothetical protein